MKKTIYAEGGRPFYDDDIQTIQDEAQAAALAIYAGLGRDCIVVGCTVAATGSTYTVAPGLVYIGGELLRFFGASGAALPAVLVAGAVSVLDERAYETGESKTCIQEQFAVLQAGTAGVLVYPAGGLTLQHLLRATQWEIGDLKYGNLVAADYDLNTGIGVAGGPAWGWALANGQGKAPDLGGRFVVGLNPDSTDYATVGAIGGEAAHTLTIAESATHDHASGLKITDSKGDGEANFNAALVSSPDAKGKAIKTESVGGGQPHENRPPFYTMAAKVWIGF